MAKEDFSWKKEFVVPVLLILISGLVGIIVAYSWEYFQFKRETLFEKRVDLIIESREKVTEIFVEFDRTRRFIRATERQNAKTNNGKCNPENLRNEIEQLKILGLRLAYLDEFSKGIMSSDSISINIVQFKEQFKQYLNCLENNYNCDVCSDNYPELMKPLQKIIELHTDELNNQIRIND